MTDEIFFGSYPQSIKKENIEIDESKSYIINNWKCYKGSDGEYYVKEASHNLNPVTDKLYDKLYFSDSQKLERNKEYYYKIEPISWDVIKEKEKDTLLLMSKKALDVTYFDLHIDKEDKALLRNVNENSIIPSDYTYSNLRAFLNSLDGSLYEEKDYRNNGFLDRAFTKREKEKIEIQIVDNSRKASIAQQHEIDNLDNFTTSNTFSDTKDKVACLSMNEVSKIKNRTRKPTDYALSKGGFNLGMKEGCWWWLRNQNWNDFLGFENIIADYVQDDGDIDIGIRTDLNLCLVPLLVLKK